MKYSFLIVLFILLTSTAQASYCSGKNWQDTYQFYTQNIDLLNDHIDRYNTLLSKISLSDIDDDKQKLFIITSAINDLDQLNIDVEILERKFDSAQQLWQLISEHCLDDGEADYNRKAIENARGADIGRTEVYDLLSRITSLRIHFFQVVELIDY
ncbi:hypothetical protein [Moritella sp. F3]|uniref:hypothetical protein n=1 Tax=Moritella sp. F3 TaxID=2718882 RepID=UPI0018E12374|nr:hypothetical protein [Moritella sp. F3]GIC75491.1 hypothetical protein FMO001_02180 [Moritella sp. F1]GIC80636.1 hypothetical protein FMO003_09170 [Moritella sp. F3]